MTAILGYVDGDEMLMMADSNTWAGCRLVAGEQPKVFVHGPALIGTAGGLRHRQIVRYHVETLPRCEGPEAAAVDYVEGLMVGWVEKVRVAFREHGFMGKEKEYGVDNFGQDDELIVAYAGHLWTLDPCWAVIHHGQGPTAVGCATQAARAAMVALLAREPKDMDYGLKVEALMRRALEATAVVDSHIRSPFTLLRAPWR